MKLCTMCNKVRTSRPDGLCSPCRMGSVASEAIERTDNGTYQSPGVPEPTEADLRRARAWIDEQAETPAPTHAVARLIAAVRIEATRDLRSEIEWLQGRVKIADGDAAKLAAERDRLREVIRTGGAMYRAERACMGIPGGIDPNDALAQRTSDATAEAHVMGSPPPEAMDLVKEAYRMVVKNEGPKPCPRGCSECEGDHCLIDFVGMVCKHCEAIAEECSACEEGTVYADDPDENEEERAQACDECNGSGFIMVQPPVVIAAKETFLDALRDGGLDSEARAVLESIRDDAATSCKGHSTALYAMDLIAPDEPKEGRVPWRITAAGLHVLVPVTNAPSPAPVSAEATSDAICGSRRADGCPCNLDRGHGGNEHEHHSLSGNRVQAWPVVVASPCEHLWRINGTVRECTKCGLGAQIGERGGMTIMSNEIELPAEWRAKCVVEDEDIERAKQWVYGAGNHSRDDTAVRSLIAVLSEVRRQERESRRERATPEAEEPPIRGMAVRALVATLGWKEEDGHPDDDAIRRVAERLRDAGDSSRTVVLRDGSFGQVRWCSKDGGNS